MIGRELEQRRLLQAWESDESEFVVVYGRRRIGKTYLVRETFGNEFVFQHTGLANSSFKVQLQAFRSSLGAYGLKRCPALSNWLMAFEKLKELIQGSKESKKVVFIDEMPWLDTARSGFISAFEHFWNGWAAWQKNIVLVICGSATSWITKKILRSRGGLHNRVTLEIRLLPFTLRECEEYANSRGLAYTRRQIVECYMALGGVPFYWKFLERGFSPAQNLDRLLFQPQAALGREYQILYDSLFHHPEPYKAIVMALTKRKAGLTRKELAEYTGIPNNGLFSQYLDDLEECGFIRKYTMFGKRKNGMLYQLMDNYSRFYAEFIAANKTNNPQFWSSVQGTSKYSAWAGLAFEMVCLEHVEKIRQALQVSGVLTNVCSWRSQKSQPGAQIDLVLDRNDGIINLCEMKFTQRTFVMTDEEIQELLRKREVLRAETQTRKALHITLISSSGANDRSTYSEMPVTLTVDSLFT